MGLETEYRSSRRDISIDMMAAVNIENKLNVATSLVNQKAFTKDTLDNISWIQETGIVNGMSVVPARAFDTETIINSSNEIHSIDFPLSTGFKEIISAYSGIIKNEKMSPRKLLSMATSIGGEFLMHTDKGKEIPETKKIIEEMILRENFGILRMDSAIHLTDMKKTVETLREMKSNIADFPLYVAIELKPSKILPSFESNINAFNDLNKKLMNENIESYISLDVRALSLFFNTEEESIEKIGNIIGQTPEIIGFMEISGKNHISPLGDTVSEASIQMVKDAERHKLPWGNKWNRKKLGFIIETHPRYLKDLNKQLSENRNIVF